MKSGAANGVRQQFGFWGLVVGLWLLLVFAFAGQLVVTNTDVSWGRALQASLRDWLPWSFLGPLAGWLAMRFPLERGQFRLRLPLHIGACMVAVLVCQVLAPRPPMRTRERPTAEGYRLVGPRPGELLRDGGPPGPPRGMAEGLGSGPVGPPGRPEGAEPPGPGRQGAGRPRDAGALPGPEGGPMGALAGLAGQAQFNISVYWIIVSVAHVLMFYRRLQERERRALELEASLADARLETLRMQVHPHFLFNTLNAIATLVHKDPAAADEMIANLSELLRTTLDTSKQQQIPLRRELEFLDRYLEIQQVRFGDRLRIEKQIDAAALELEVPTLILQPLVENAIRHGIEPRPGPGHICIQARREAEVLRLVVRDNGVGPKKGAPQQEGIGLANTRARLQHLFGPAARLVLKTGPEGGYEVELEIPCGGA